MSKKVFLALASAVLLAGSAAADLTIEVGKASQSPESEAAVAKFQADYAAGGGLTYVRMPNEEGKMTLYRYGNGSRNGVYYQTPGQPVTYWLYTCGSQRKIVFPDDAGIVAKTNPQFIRMGDSGYETAEDEYEAVSNGCYNPLVWARTGLEKLVTYSTDK